MTKLEALVVTGELIFLTPEQRIQFYVQNCHAMGLNPHTRPLQYFEQIDRNGKRQLILYALRGASVQLAANHGLTAFLSKAEFSHDAVMFTATVRNNLGREDSAVGVTSLKGLEGKEYADAIMAAQTKAKRRAILDFVGSGLLDESEIEGMKGATVEVTENDLKDYVPIAPAPTPVTAEAPATEVVDNKFTEWPIGKTLEVKIEGPSIPAEITKAANELVANAVKNMQREQIVSNEKYELAADALGPDTAKNAPVPAPEAISSAQNQFTEAEITSRLNSYRRDTLQQGGMRPSKGFGIAAKWSKFLLKRAPGKSVAEYVEVLKTLDGVFQKDGANGVVAFVEAEIAA
jgi:hypothetical protein